MASAVAGAATMYVFTFIVNLICLYIYLKKKKKINTPMIL